MNDFSRQSPLLPDVAVMGWYPDEILFSLASRYHILSGNSSASVTCMRLFGHPQRGAQHDLPSRIEEFARRTGSLLGAARDIIDRHTLLPFYLPMRDAEESASAQRLMCGDGIGSLKYKLGILTSRFRAHHPLKACPQCMVDDHEKYQVAYWHLSHQYPGVWICLDHGVVLRESTVKSNGVGRFLWCLPSNGNLTGLCSNFDRCEDAASAIGFIKSLARASQALARLPPACVDMRRLLSAYLDELQRLGFCSPGGRIRLDDVGVKFADAVSPLRIIPELAALPRSPQEAKEQIGRLLRVPRTGTHPLRHLVFIVWLFGAWENFWKAYSQAPDVAFTDSAQQATLPKRGANEADIQRRHQALDLMTSGGYAASRAAKAVGVDVSTAMAWATQAGVPIRRRPKVLTSVVRGLLIDGLRRGCEKAELAELHCIAVGTVTRMLRTEVGLQQAWHDARFNRAREQARRLWKKAAEKNPMLEIKAIRLLEPAAYAWLYRNDRDWLKVQTISLPKRPQGNNTKVDWDKRDSLLAQAVRQISMALSDRGCRTLTLQQLYQRLPELRAKLSKLERLPLTRQAIEIALRRDTKNDKSSDPLF